MSQEGVLTYVVRHGDAGDKAAWRGVDGERPLSNEGWRHAGGLVVGLEDFPIDRILSSPALRCRQTVGPVAALNGLPVEDCDLLGIGAEAAALAAFINGRESEGVVMCTHGEVLQDLLAILIGERALVTDCLVWPKGSTWVLQRTVGGRLRARFLPPLAWPVAPTRAHDNLCHPPTRVARMQRPSQRRVYTAFGDLSAESITAATDWDESRRSQGAVG